MAYEDLIDVGPVRIQLGIAGEPTGRLIDLVAPIPQGRFVAITGATAETRNQFMMLLSNILHSNGRTVIHLNATYPDFSQEARISPSQGEILRNFNEAFEELKGKVESGHDVVLFINSLQELGRLLNFGNGISLAKLTTTVQHLRSIILSAKNFDNGSLTIFSSLFENNLIEELIFNEMLDLASVEIPLDSRLVGRVERIMGQLIDVNSCRSYDEQDFIPHAEMERIHLLRRYVQDLNIIESIEWILGQINASQDNHQLLNQMSI